MAKPQLFGISNGGITVKVTNVGASITSLMVPDSRGITADVVLGFDSLDAYVNDNAPYFGCIVGRVANRIKGGKFTLNGTEYTLPANNGPNSLHGYPGDVTVTATYSLPSKNSLKLEMEATAGGKATPINLAQHTYWNLAGHDSGDILGHLIRISSRHMTPIDRDTIPTGEIAQVENTPFDFGRESRIGDRIDRVPGGYDHNYVLDCGEEKLGLKHVAEVRDPSSDRVLNLWSDALGVQFYTGNYVDGVQGKEGAIYRKHAGLCLETQGFPDAVNQPNFPAIVVQPGDTYSHTMLFEFSPN